MKLVSIFTPDSSVEAIMKKIASDMGNFVIVNNTTEERMPVGVSNIKNECAGVDFLMRKLDYQEESEKRINRGAYPLLNKDPNKIFGRKKKGK